MSGWNEQSARSIALDLLRGGRAELVGGKNLRGTSPTYLEIDGVPVEVPAPLTKESTGIRVILPDGFVALYLAPTHERARDWLRRAEALAKAADRQAGQPAPEANQKQHFRNDGTTTA